MVAKEKMTPQQKIESAIDDMDMFVRTCNGPEFADEIDFLSGYLEDTYRKRVITMDDYTNRKASIKQRIRQFGESCDCNIKGELFEKLFINKKR